MTDIDSRSATTGSQKSKQDNEQKPSPSAPARVVQYFLRTPSLWTFVVLILLAIFFTVASGGSFGSASNLRNVLLDGSLLMVVSVGMTLVIITGGIDLSVGAVTIFGSVAAAQLMTAIGGDNPLVITVGMLAAIVVGVAWGAVNGLLVSYARVAALIATLGTLGMATGLALVITGGINARSVPVSLVEGIGNGNLFGVPYLVIIAAIVTILGAIYLGRTRSGLYLYSIGSNKDAALRSGIRVRANLTSVYMIAGGLAGLAGFLSLARFATTDLSGHTTDNLQAIAAVVLGGTSLFGGRGGIAGTIPGVLIPVVLANGFVILGVQPFWQQFAIGLVLVLAVYTDQLRRRRLENE